MSVFKKAFFAWIPLALVGSVLTLLTYTGIQQALRQSANDPQIQMAEDAAASLDNGSTPQSLLPAQMVDPTRSLAPFLIITGSDSNKVLASNAVLGPTLPLPPAGAFKVAHDKGENRITWQPNASNRFATVIVSYSGPHPGYVLAARSSHEVEDRIDQLTEMTLLAGLGMLIGNYLLYLILI